MYGAIHEAIPHTSYSNATLLYYKYLQHVTTEDNVWKLFEHVLQKTPPNRGGKAEYIQKQIYDL